VTDTLANDYRIQKERLTVVLTTTSGERIAGDLFVQATARNRFGREGAHDIVNAAEPYFPMHTANGEMLLLAKEGVRDIAVGREQEPPDSWCIGEATTIELRLVDGMVHVGVVYLDSASGRTRVLDYLNRLHDRFLVLHVPDGLMLVNRRMIERVRPID
jgi:hypothetical protein